MNTTFIKSLATCMLILSTAPKAWCALGEDETQITRRFGDPIGHRSEKGYTVSDYHFKVYNISVFFWHGKSASEVYKRADGLALSDTEIADFLATNGGGQTWEPMGGGDEYHIEGWTRDGGNVIACYNFQDRSLDISSPDFDNVVRHSID